MTEPVRGIPGVRLQARLIPLGPAAILQDVDFSVTSGIHAIVGANGVGKSTLLRSIAALNTACLDELLWDGASAMDMTIEQRAHVRSAVLSARRPEFALTCLEYVATAVRARRQQERRSRAWQLLESVGIAAKAEQDIHSVSAGEWAWVRLAHATAANPSILVLDELDEAIDTAARRRLYSHIRTAVATVVAVTHDRASAGIWADSIWEIASGRLSLVTER